MNHQRKKKENKKEKEKAAKLLNNCRKHRTIFRDTPVQDSGPAGLKELAFNLSKEGKQRVPRAFTRGLALNPQGLFIPSHQAFLEGRKILVWRNSFKTMKAEALFCSRTQQRCSGEGRDSAIG